MYRLHRLRYPYKDINCKVDFNLNGHGSPKPDTQNVRGGDRAKEPNAPTADGYIFKGWTRNPDGTDPWNFNDPVTKDMTLYADWEEVIPPTPDAVVYIVTFDARGYAPNPPQQAVEEGGLAREPVLGEPTLKDNKLPDGNWYRSPSDADNKIAPWNFDTDTVNDNITLYSGADEKKSANVNAELALPAQTYIGHTVYGLDYSTYEYDGTTYSAQRAAAEGIGKGSIRITPNSNVNSSKVNSITHKLVFH